MQPKIIDYTTIGAAGLSDLQHKVNKFIAGDWQPLGGIAISQNGNEVWCAQAMVKYEQVEVKQPPEI